MSIEDTLVKLIAAVNDCTAAIKENTAAKGSRASLVRVETRGPANPVANDEVAVTGHATTGHAETQTLAEQKKAAHLADIPQATYEEVAKLFAAVYANGANKADALAAIAPLPHLKDIKANGEQHPGQLAALKGKLLAAAQKVGALV
jgi:hypothetical protein